MIVTKRYRIDVDCANCAAKMEDAIKRIEGVDDDQKCPSCECSVSHLIEVA